MDRYDAAGNIEAQHEPGSGGRVLRNLLGITSPEYMDEVELDLLDQLYDRVLDSVRPDAAITVTDLREWHRQWLGNVYPWAGKDRTVNMSKGEFMFASARHVPRLISEFEERFLRVHTPCRRMAYDRLMDALAVTHVEFVLIHPFREGNGRHGTAPRKRLRDHHVHQ